MIEVKMHDVVDNIEFFTEFAKRPMRAKVAFQAARMLDGVIAEYNRFNSVKDELIKRYGKRGTDGELVSDDKGNYYIQEGKEEECAKQLEELMGSDLQINAEPIALDDLPDIEFTPAQMYSLQHFLKV